MSTFFPPLVFGMKIHGMFRMKIAHTVWMNELIILFKCHATSWPIPHGIIRHLFISSYNISYTSLQYTLVTGIAGHIQQKQNKTEKNKMQRKCSLKPRHIVKVFRRQFVFVLFHFLCVVRALPIKKSNIVITSSRQF